MIGCRRESLGREGGRKEGRFTYHMAGGVVGSELAEGATRWGGEGRRLLEARGREGYQEDAIQWQRMQSEGGERREEEEGEENGDGRGGGRLLLTTRRGGRGDALF